MISNQEDLSPLPNLRIFRLASLFGIIKINLDIFLFYSYFAVGGSLNSDAVVQIWDLDTIMGSGTQKPTMTMTAGQADVSAVQFTGSKDRLIIIGCGDKIFCADWRSGKILQEFYLRFPANRIFVAPDASCLAFVDSKNYVYMLQRIQQLNE